MLLYINLHSRCYSSNEKRVIPLFSIWPRSMTLGTGENQIMYSECTLMKRYCCSSCFYLQANAKEAALVGNIVKLTGTWFYVLFSETILIYHPAIWKSWKCAEDLFGQKSLGFIAELEPKVHFWAANKGTTSICHKKKRRSPIGNHLFSTYWQHLSSIRRRKPIRNSPWWCWNKTNGHCTSFQLITPLVC